MPADQLTTVPVLLPLRPCSAGMVLPLKVVLLLEPCPACTVQLRLFKLANWNFHHTSGGVWTISQHRTQFGVELLHRHFDLAPGVKFVEFNKFTTPWSVVEGA